jgi:catechol 2,3-dioxygenase-like lactoylglutathione lyase family enzyme
MTALPAVSRTGSVGEHLDESANLRRNGSMHGPAANCVTNSSGSGLSTNADQTREVQVDTPTRAMLTRVRMSVGLLTLMLLLTVGLLAPSAPTAQAQHAPAAVAAVESVGMTVSDMDASVAFYVSVLGFQKLSDIEVFGQQYEHLQGVFGLRMRVVRLGLGDEILELTEYLAPRGRPIPPDARSNDRSFQHIAIIVRDMDEAYSWLRQNRVQHASTGPQTIPEWNTGAAGIRAFYFRDPDGHTLEVLSFPPDKGAPKWQSKDQLFLGIDHTAIVVGDTEASLQFYRDTLGMQVAGAGENFGTEQEHLNNVFGARLRITSLKAAAGPAVELLEYLTPRDGRPYPSDLRANDLSHWQTRLVTPNAEATIRQMRAAGVPFVSPGLIALPADTLGFSHGAMVRDPDGHAMQLVQR